MTFLSELAIAIVGPSVPVVIGHYLTRKSLKKTRAHIEKVDEKVNGHLTELTMQMMDRRPGGRRKTDPPGRREVDRCHTDSTD